MAIEELSLGEEMMWDEWADYQVQTTKISINAAKGLWTKKDGNKIKVVDMENNYIYNCINYLKRNNQYDINTPYIDMFKKELDRREKVKKFKQLFKNTLNQEQIDFLLELLGQGD